MLWDRCSPWEKKELEPNTATDYLFNGRQQTRFHNMFSKPIWEVSALLTGDKIRKYIKRKKKSEK